MAYLKNRWVNTFYQITYAFWFNNLSTDINIFPLRILNK